MKLPKTLPLLLLVLVAGGAVAAGLHSGSCNAETYNLINTAKSDLQVQLNAGEKQFASYMNQAEKSDGKALMDAIEKSDSAKVKALIEKGVDINAKESGSTPLIRAIQQTDEKPSASATKILDMLLAQADINVNLTDSEGMTPLIWACMQLNEEIVKKLLANPAIKVNQKVKIGEEYHTALSALAVFADENPTAAAKIRKLLTDKGAVNTEMGKKMEMCL